VVQDTPILSAAEMFPKNVVLALYRLWRYSRRLSRMNALSIGGHIWAAEYYNITRYYFKIQLQA